MKYATGLLNSTMGAPLRFLAFACIMVLTLPGYGEERGPPAPERNPARSAATADETSAAPAVEPNLPGDKPTVAWTEAEIATAKATCEKQLAGLDLAYKPLPPIKEGLCGAPAPILLSAIGGVAISPPAIMRCGLAAKLDGWLEKRVQPTAKATLGSAVVEIQNATSYNCRNRYGGANTRISEHAFANALDISEFVLASGKHVTVLKSWPRAVPSSTPEQIANETTGTIVPVSTRRIDPNPATETSRPGQRPSTNPFVVQHDEVIVPVDPRTNPFVAPASVTSAPPPPPQVAKPPAAARPAPEAEASSADQAALGRTAFVRGVHADACKFFGTVLGPEANAAHRNHFHLDMKPRRHSNFCE